MEINLKLAFTNLHLELLAVFIQDINWFKINNVLDSSLHYFWYEKLTVEAPFEIQHIKKQSNITVLMIFYIAK